MPSIEAIGCAIFTHEHLLEVSPAAGIGVPRHTHTRAAVDRNLASGLSSTLPWFTDLALAGAFLPR
jgi:hypothetical protein